MPSLHRATIVLLVASSCTVACTTRRRVPITPWLHEVHWKNETIVAESGLGRGVYLERTDERRRVVRVEGWACHSMDDGRAALCQEPGGAAAFLLRRSGEHRTLACGDGLAGDTTTYASIEKVSEREIACIERRYAPINIVVTTRRDLEGRVLDRREAPIRP